MIKKKILYLSRHGQSQFNVEKLIGGNSGLTYEGINYSKLLFNYFKDKNVNIWTSKLKRTIQTASFFDKQFIKNYDELNEINSGICDSMTYQEIEKKFPEEFNKRKNNKYYYRYPNGESYADINKRLQIIYKSIDQSNQDILIIAHQAVLRVLISNYIKRNINEIPYIEVSLNTVYKITIDQEYCTIESVRLI
tara:strand:- start:155 stop:733 length:579 start_codon:yes stop_codon:yes gene_type:complete